MNKEEKYLIITNGFFGDIIFSSSIAEKIKEENKLCSIEYLIGFPQVKRLLQNNPYIDKVHLSDFIGPNPINKSINYADYKVIKLKQLNYILTPTEEYQISADIKNPSSKYKIYTENDYDLIAKDYCDELRKKNNKKIIALMSNWESKTYLFTKEQYKKGINVPNLGYGGSHRNINWIVNKLKDHFILYEIGVNNLNQIQTAYYSDEDQKSLLFESSIMKYCDAFVGTDGGLATIAAGVGTKTIITGDFNLQLYGWNGVLKKIKNPKLGPREYFGDPHIVLDPYYTDQEILDNIIKNIK
jgi:hypothetical protein